MTAPDFPALVAAARDRMDQAERWAKDATQPPWGYNGYSAIVSPDRGHDAWALAAIEKGHSLDQRACKVCGHGCRHADEDYHRDPVVATVPAHHGDTAIGKRVADGEHIGFWDPGMALGVIRWGRDVLERHTYDLDNAYCAGCRQDLLLGDCSEDLAVLRAWVPDLLDEDQR